MSALGDLITRKANALLFAALPKAHHTLWLKTVVAAERGDMPTLHACLRRGPDLNTPMQAPHLPMDLTTPLMAAAAAGQTEALKALLPLCDPKVALRHGPDALYYAINGSNLDGALALIPVSNPRASYMWGDCPLLRAAKLCGPGQGEREAIGLQIMEALLPLSNPASMDHQQTNALMICAERNSRAGVELMLSRISAQHQDMHGRTALMLAASSGAREVIDLLIPKSDLLAKDSQGLRASDHARHADLHDLADILMGMELAEEQRRALAKDLGAPIKNAPRTKPRSL